MFYFLFLLYVDHRDIPVLTPSFPTLRFSDLGATSPTAFDSGFAGVGGVAPTYGLAHTLFGSPSRARRVLARARRAKANAIASATASTQNGAQCPATALRSEEHTSELQSLMRISYAVFCLKKKKKQATRK